MKHIILAALVCFSSVTVVFAQNGHSGHQQQKTVTKTESANKSTITESTQKQLSQLLSSYYNIKNALVTGDTKSAALNADEFVRTVNTIDYKVISEGNSHTLAQDAGYISESNDIKKQREYFANFSTNMAAVARAFKLSDQPVYLQHCPMKKASWLSSEKQIRNPYYGSSMLTCGKVIETL